MATIDGPYASTEGHLFIDPLREDYERLLSVIDEEVPQLISQGKEFRALQLHGRAVTELLELHEFLSSLYTYFWRYQEMLRQGGSERLRNIDHDLVITTAVADEVLGAEHDDDLRAGRELHVMELLSAVGYRHDHDWLKEHLPTELDYMLDVLAQLIEPDFVPLDDELDEPEEQRERRKIPASVRRSVWRRDQGKCVECGSREHLEYDHIVPHSRGGSDTDRNIQLLCQGCNRRKGATVG